MTWVGDPRTTTPEWRRTRQRILDRDRRICHICGRPGADQVDHLRSVAECKRLGINADVDTNLAAIHAVPCHRTKSSAEGNAARWRHRQNRSSEPHPGQQT